MSRKIFVVFHNDSNYDNHFIFKELAREFEGQLECLRENTEKYKTFSVPIEKEIKKVDNDGNKNIVAISYKIKITDIDRFMESSLSHLVDNPVKRIHKFKCKDCNSFLEYEIFIHDLINFKCLSCNKNYSKKINTIRETDSKTHLNFLTILIILFCC